MDTPQLAAMPVLKQREERLEKIRHLIHQTKKTAKHSLVFSLHYLFLLLLALWLSEQPID